MNFQTIELPKSTGNWIIPLPPSFEVVSQKPDELVVESNLPDKKHDMRVWGTGPGISKERLFKNRRCRITFTLSNGLLVRKVWYQEMGEYTKWPLDDETKFAKYSRSSTSWNTWYVIQRFLTGGML